jgi:hypothetical protein
MPIMKTSSRSCWFRPTSTTLAIGLGVVTTFVAAEFRGNLVSAQTSSAELRLLPPDAAFVGFADIRAVLTSRVWRQLRDSMPVSPEHQGEFEARTGISVERDIDRVFAFVWQTAGGGQPNASLLLVRGRFDAVKIEALVRAHGATVETYQGERLFLADVPVEAGSASGRKEEIALSFIEPGLAAVGTRGLVEEALDRRSAGAGLAGNTEIMTLVRSMEGSDLWAVGRFEAFGGAERLPPAVAAQIPPIAWIAFSARISLGIGGVLQVEARDEPSAEALRVLAQKLIALGRMQAPVEPGARALLDSLELGGTGRTVTLSFEAPPDLLDWLAARH